MVKLWAVPKKIVNDLTNKAPYDWDAAVEQCGGVDNILTRYELSNSPYIIKNVDANWTYTPNYYTRSIGGGIFNEWGFVAGSYPGTLWTDGSYWAVDKSATAGKDNQFIVEGWGGSVRYSSTYYKNYVACRG